MRKYLPHLRIKKSLIHKIRVIVIAFRLIFNNQSPINSKGFTLIEILVAFSIMVVLTAVSIIGFSNYNQVQQMSQTASNIQLLINQARSNAQSVVKTIPDQNGTLRTCGNDQLESYKVTLVNPTTIKLEMVCKDTASPPLVPTLTTYSFDIRTIVLLTGMSLTSTCGGNEISFEGFYATVSSTFCDFTLTRGSATKIIRVNNGNIQIL